MNAARTAPPAADAGRARTLTVWHVAALGIGSMVGAGIFALLGQAALVVRSETWVAFAIGGVIALLSGYSYARLGARYPSAGGIIDFFTRGLPPVLAATLSLLYLVTLALTIAMVARAFGAYAARLFHEAHGGMAVNAYAAGIIVLLTVVNLIGSGAAGRAELLLVSVKLGILALLMVAGATTIKPQMLQMHTHLSGGNLLASVGLTFFAYAGYGMMANAAADVRDPEHTMPRAFTIAILVTLALYVLLAIVVLGNIPPAELAKYADTAVAQAAVPVLGQAGFTIVAVGALLATASAINATLFSALKIMEAMGRSGTLPAIYTRAVWRKGTVGLLVSVGAVLLLTVTLNLGALANVASATFLLCYLAVFVAAWRLRHEIAASPALLLVGFTAMAIVFAAFIVSLAKTGWAAIAIVAAAVALSGVLGWRAVVHRRKQA
jgi:amino acid transporter